MKKIFLLSLILLISSDFILAANVTYDNELRKIRTVKNAQMSVINEKINNIVSDMEDLQVNTNITTEEKNQKMTPKKSVFCHFSSSKTPQFLPFFGLFLRCSFLNS